MKNKSLFYLLIVGLIIMVSVLSACATGTVEYIDGKPIMKHSLDAIGFENCFACHAGGLYPVPEAYAGMPIELCSPGCHILMGTPMTTPPPTTTTTTPPTTTPPTTTTTTPPITTTGGPPVLDLAALSLSRDFHPDVYLTLCLLCHGPGVGVRQFPLPPTWPGTNKTPGPWEVIPGSTQDHTGRTVDQCISEGCHQLGQ